MDTLQAGQGLGGELLSHLGETVSVQELQEAQIIQGGEPLLQLTLQTLQNQAV